MDNVLERAAGFKGTAFPEQSALYRRLASDGQNPKALMISCADSRMIPEIIAQAQPGDLFMRRDRSSPPSVGVRPEPRLAARHMFLEAAE